MKLPGGFCLKNNAQKHFLRNKKCKPDSKLKPLIMMF